MLKYIEVLRALEYVRSDPTLSHEERVAILRDLRNNMLPGVGFEGAEKATIEILRKKFADATTLLQEGPTDSHGQGPTGQGEDRHQVEAPILDSGEGRTPVVDVLDDARPAHRAQKPRRQKK
jgi:hypothetical protein